MASWTEIKEEKAKIVKDIGKNPANTGSTGVQIGLITNRINTLKNHFNANPKDHHSRQGLLALVGQRRRLLAYLKRSNQTEYGGLIKKLGIRK